MTRSSRFDLHCPPRRDVLILGAACAVVPVVPACAQRQATAATPAQVEGPYYPGASLIASADNDLLEAGRGLAAGIETRLFGRILDADRAPIRGALVEIWQCDSGGTYHHPSDSGRRDERFQGFGRTAAGADGRYAFRTIRPVPYGMRTPHIHFKVQAPGHRQLTTQLYVAEETERNRVDAVYRDLSEAEARAVTVSFANTGKGHLTAVFDVVLQRA